VVRVLTDLACGSTPFPHLTPSRSGSSGVTEATSSTVWPSSPNHSTRNGSPGPKTRAAWLFSAMYPLAPSPLVKRWPTRILVRGMGDLRGGHLDEGVRRLPGGGDVHGMIVTHQRSALLAGASLTSCGILGQPRPWHTGPHGRKPAHWARPAWSTMPIHWLSKRSCRMSSSTSPMRRLVSGVFGFGCWCPMRGAPHVHQNGGLPAERDQRAGAPGQHVTGGDGRWALLMLRAAGHLGRAGGGLHDPAPFIIG
jgi:hypothetical protein